jgi:hypothetical protein
MVFRRLVILNDGKPPDPSKPLLTGGFDAPQSGVARRTMYYTWNTTFPRFAIELLVAHILSDVDVYMGRLRDGHLLRTYGVD